jgi:hypothetical protein
MSRMDPVADVFVRSLPLIFALCSIVALGLVITDGASWVTFVGFFVGMPIILHVSGRRLDRYHAHKDESTRTTRG